MARRNAQNAEKPNPSAMAKKNELKEIMSLRAKTHAGGSRGRRAIAETLAARRHEKKLHSKHQKWRPGDIA